MLNDVVTSREEGTKEQLKKAMVVMGELNQHLATIRARVKLRMAHHV